MQEYGFDGAALAHAQAEYRQLLNSLYHTHFKGMRPQGAQALRREHDVHPYFSASDIKDVAFASLPSNLAQISKIYLGNLQKVHISALSIDDESIDISLDNGIGKIGEEGNLYVWLSVNTKDASTSITTPEEEDVEKPNQVQLMQELVGLAKHFRGKMQATS